MKNKKDKNAPRALQIRQKKDDKLTYFSKEPKMSTIAGKNFANEENSKIHEARGNKRKLKSKADSRNKVDTKVCKFQSERM